MASPPMPPHLGSLLCHTAGSFVDIMAGFCTQGSLQGVSAQSVERARPASTSCNLPRPSNLPKSHSFSSGCLQLSRLSDTALRRSICVRAAANDDEEDDEAPKRQAGRGGRGNRGRKPPPDDDSPRVDAEGFQERLLQVSRVTKVVKGGKQMSFRAVVAVGDTQGRVGVGCSSAKEVVTAVEKAGADARRHVITVPITRGFTFPHRVNGIAGGAKVMLRPASEGTGVIAGGSVREVLELSGIKNGFGKQLGSDNPLNNARATVDGLLQMRTLAQAAQDRDLTVDQMLGHNQVMRFYDTAELFLRQCVGNCVEEIVLLGVATSAHGQERRLVTVHRQYDLQICLGALTAIFLMCR